MCCVTAARERKALLLARIRADGLKKQSFLVTCPYLCDIIDKLGQCAGILLICKTRGSRRPRQREKYERY